MSLKDTITEDMKTAMRAKDAPRLLTIRGLLAAIKQREVDDRIVLDDAAVIAIVDKLGEAAQGLDHAVHGRQSAGPGRQGVGRAGRARRLSAATPRRRADRREVAKVIAELGASGPADMGKVMGAVKTRLAGKADMALVSSAVKQALSR
jgi:uncharacterized protein YqeY